MIAQNARYRQIILKSLFVLMMLCGRRSIQEADPKEPDNIFANGAFITLYGYASTGPKLERRTCKSMLQCGHFCLKNSKCVSYNYQLSSSRGGTCELSEEGIVSKEERDARFKQKPGFVFVQTVRKDLKINSCLDHLRSGRKYSGFYNILDNDGLSYAVYCDLTSEPSAAWTLIMSENTTAGSPLFQEVPLFLNNPVNEGNPDWNAFRLSLSKMEQLRNRSTHWRVTCSFQLDGLVYRDFVLATISDFDPTELNGGEQCKRLQYINVRGHNCSKCTAAWWQFDKQMLHHDSEYNSCEFGKTSDGVVTEDNFGFYGSFNPKFRCNMPNRDSTTNHWFGAYLE